MGRVSAYVRHRLLADVLSLLGGWPDPPRKRRVQQIEPRLLEVSRVLGLSARERAFKIVLPAIVPRLFVALRLGVAVALVVAVTVEIAANPNGMGYAMMIAQQSFDPALMLAWLGWIGVVGYAINVAMLALQRSVARRMGAAT